MKKLLRNLTFAGWLSFIGILLVLLVAIFAPLLTANDPMETDPMRRLSKEEGFPLGCDQLGQCVYSRLIYGARLSLIIGFSARLSALLIGLAVGLAAGYAGGWLDWFLMRVVDMFLAFPVCFWQSRFRWSWAAVLKQLSSRWL